MLTLAAPFAITPEVYDRVVYDREPLALDPDLLATIERQHARFLALLAGGASCYGVNTGFGAMIGTAIDEADWPALQRNVLRARAAATGAPFAAEIARGMMLARLVNLLSGRSAVSAALCQFIVDRLNDGWTPWVPSLGHGMAGEIIPLCHMAQTFVGDGFVIGENGARVPAAEALAARGIPPYRPQAKEGLALINGVAASPAYAIEVARRVARVAALLTLIAAATVEAMAASLEPYDAEVGRLRPEPGIARVAGRLRRHLVGTTIARVAHQGPISLLVIPQVMGALDDALAHTRAAIATELRSISDNPVFVDDADGGRILATGTFHNQHLTLSIEALALALAHAAGLGVRRLHRLLDGRYSGLAHQLSLRPGMDAGLVILHKATLALEARIMLLAAPVSLHQGEASFGQEDVAPMIFPALDRLAEMAELARLIGAYELYAACVGLDQRRAAAGDDVESLKALVRAVVPPYDGDRSYGPEIEVVESLLDGAAVGSLCAP